MLFLYIQVLTLPSFSYLTENNDTFIRFLTTTDTDRYLIYTPVTLPDTYVLNFKFRIREENKKNCLYATNNYNWFGVNEQNKFIITMAQVVYETEKIININTIYDVFISITPSTIKIKIDDFEISLTNTTDKHTDKSIYPYHSTPFYNFNKLHINPLYDLFYIKYYNTDSFSVIMNGLITNKTYFNYIPLIDNTPEMIQNQWKLGEGKTKLNTHLICQYNFNKTLNEEKYQHELVTRDPNYYFYEDDYGIIVERAMKIKNSLIFDFEHTDNFAFTIDILTKSDNKMILFGNGTYKLTLDINTTFSYNNKKYLITPDLRDNNKHNIIIQYIGGVVEIYVDYVKQVITETGHTTNKNPFQSMYLGSDYTGYDVFDGTIFSFRAFNNFFTEREIPFLKSNGVTRLRTDNTFTKRIETEFIHKNHLVSLQNVAKAIGTDLYFDSQRYIVYIEDKGRRIKIEEFNIRDGNVKKNYNRY